MANSAQLETASAKQNRNANVASAYADYDAIIIALATGGYTGS